MAGNRKFHNKFHSANHHTLPSPHIKDSGLDPVASHEFPFIGDFVLNGVVSASNNYLLNGRNLSDNLDSVPHGASVPPGWNVFRDSTYIDGDCTITGNLSALGELTYLHTQVHSTSAQEIEIRADNTNGITAALTVDQYGTNDIVHFKNDGSSTLLITGSANNTETLGGWIGINLGNLPDVDRPNQRMTIVGSVSVVPDPSEVADQNGQADPGTSGTLYIEGGLHVNDKTFLDQVTVDTTDGPFLVSGGSTGSDGHSFDVDIPTNLDQVTIVTDDGDFEVSGSNKMFIDTEDEDGVGLDVDTHAKFDQVSIDTNDGPFRIIGGGGISIAKETNFDIDSTTTLDKTTIDTIDGPFEVKSSQANVIHGNEIPMDVDVPVHLDRVTVDTDDGEFLVTTSSIDNMLRVEVPTHINNRFVVDTTTENSTISGGGKVVITNTDPSGVGLDVQDTITKLDRTTIDTKDGNFLVHTTGTSNSLRVQVPTELEKLTVNTTNGPVRILGDDPFVNQRQGVTFDVPTVFNGDVTFNTTTNNVTFSGTQGSVKFNVPTISFESHTQLDRVTVNTTPIDANNRKDFTVIGSGIVDINSDINTRDATLLAGDTDIALQGGDKVKISGSGNAEINVPSIFNNSVSINSTFNVDVTNGNTNIFDSQTSWEDKNEVIIGVPTRTQALSASTEFGPVKIHGYDYNLEVDANAEFNNALILNGYTESTNLFRATGRTQLAETLINTTDGEFEVGGNTRMLVRPNAKFEGNVHIEGDITVDGNAYLSAGAAGSINVGDSDIDSVVFHAEVDSDITPNVTEAYELGNNTNRWFGVNSVSATHDNTISTNITTNDLTVFDGIVDISISEHNKATFRGPGSVHVHTPLTSYNSMSATVGPFVFGGVEETIDNPREMVGPDGITVVESGIDIIPFRVECRSVFQKALTALGPVQIGDLPEGTIEGLPDPTLEVLGNAVIKDGNLKIQSDIRHLGNEGTMIRFDKDRIEFRTLSTPVMAVTVKNDKPVTIIGNHDYDTGLEIRNNHIGIFDENQISNLFDKSLDIHGNVRVTETLSARTLVVDYLTVLNQSSGNVGGGSGGTGGMFTSLSGEAPNGNVTPWQADSVSYDYTGTDTGIEFDASELHNIDVQKLYSFTFEVDDPLGTALNVGDAQSSTYQLAVKWDDVANEALYTLDEISTTTTPATPKLANIVVKVLKSKTAPFTDRIVKLVVEQVEPVDILYFAHNVLVQDRPEEIDAVSIADLDVMGSLNVHSEQTYNNVTTFVATTKFNTISSDIIPEEDTLSLGSTTDKWANIHGHDINAVNIDTQMINTGELDVSGNVHITGDLRVDGNAYLSAGAGGIINVGDATDDVVVFHADVDSDIIPNTHTTYNLGSTSSKWDTLHVETISAEQIQWSGGNSTQANDVYTNVSIASADRDSVYALVHTHSGNWESGYNSTFLNTNWNEAFTNVSEVSSIRDSVIATTVANSAQWNDSTVSFANSASYWNETTDSVTASAADWNTTHEQFIVSSAMWNEGQEQTALSAVYWNETTDSVTASAADWNDTFNSVTLSSDDWNDTYTWVSSDSATNNTTYNQSTFINADGDTMTGDLTIETDLHVKGDLTVDGNAYLSAGASGTINVGDDNQDVVSFKAMLSGDLVPNVDNKYDIGIETNKWRDIHTAGDVNWSGGDSTQSNETYNFVNTTSGTDGFANLEIDSTGKLVLKGDQVPGQAITRVHVAINASDVKNLTDSNHQKFTEVYEGHLVIIPGNGITLAAIQDNPLGTYNTIEERWEGYQKLMTPEGIIHTINGYNGPTVALNADDIGSDTTTNQFVTQDQKDRFEAVESIVDTESGFWDATKDRVVQSGYGWDETETLFSENSGGWNATSALVNNKYQSWDEASTIAVNFVNNTQEIYQYVDQGRNYWTDAYTVVAASSARWNTPEQGTASVVTRVSKHLKTPNASREYLAMQSNNPIKDTTYDNISHEHAMVMPQGTIVRRAILRGENVSGTEVTIGLHSNRLETNINTKGYKYFPDQPSEQKTKTFTANYESQVFEFTNLDEIPAGNTLGVSLSASAPFGVANITFVLEHPDYSYTTVTREIYDPSGEIAALQAQLVSLTSQVEQLLEDAPDPTFQVDTQQLPTVEAEILAIGNVPTGTIAFAADTEKILVFNADGVVPQWIEFDND